MSAPYRSKGQLLKAAKREKSARVYEEALAPREPTSPAEPEAT